MLRDRIICGIHEHALREKLLQIESLSLQKCIDTGSIRESSAQQMEQLRKGTGADVHYVKERYRPRPRPGSTQNDRSRNDRPSTSQYDAEKTCVNCTYVHRWPDYCPAAKEICRNCGMVGHFEKSTRCRRKQNVNSQGNSSRRQPIRRDNRGDDCRYDHRDDRRGDSGYDRRNDRRNDHREVKNIDADDTQMYSDDESTYLTHDDDHHEVFIDLVVDNLDALEWTKQCVIDGLSVKFKLDTGAQVNILPEEIFHNTKLSLEKSNITLRSYSGHAMKPLGETKCNVMVGKSAYFLTFQVVGGGVKPILGMRACERMNLIKRCMIDDVASAAQQNAPRTSDPKMATAKPPPQSRTPMPRASAESAAKRDPTGGMSDPLDAHADLFAGLGRLRNHEYDISVRDDVAPVKCPPRSIPHTLRNKVKAELERMESMGVIERINGPTDWVSAMIVVHKPVGRVRICLDPRGLNMAIRREHYPMPTFEQISARMPNARVFSKFDATSGYWQLPLTNKSSFLTTFNTQFGRYRYKVMPFGISSASEIWQRAMIDEFGQLEGVEVVADDILIWGENVTQHVARLAALLDKVRPFEWPETEQGKVNHPRKRTRVRRPCNQ